MDFGAHGKGNRTAGTWQHLITDILNKVSTTVLQ